MDDEEDFLEELIAESTKLNPDFPKLMEVAAQRRQAARARGEDPNAEPEEDEADTTEEQPTAPHSKR
jgi:septal ring factor EnvC (AmiA/AmiB activator)